MRHVGAFRKRFARRPASSRWEGSRQEALVVRSRGGGAPADRAPKVRILTVIAGPPPVALHKRSRWLVISTISSNGDNGLTNRSYRCGSAPLRLCWRQI